LAKQAHVSGKLAAKMTPLFYDKTALIEGYTSTINSRGEEGAFVYSTVSGMGAIPCRLSPVVEQEERRGALTSALEATHIATLAGFWNITPKMRATIAGKVYDIVAVDQDSAGYSTRLQLVVTSS
jgi:hypothetical protein